MEKTKLFSLSIILAIVLTTLITSSCTKPEEPVKIGVILSMTGKTASWGESTREALDLYADEINKESKKIELIYEDSRCDPKTGVAAANKLINVDKVQVIIGGVCSSVTLSVAPIAEQNNVVLITPVSQSSAITHVGDDIFRLSISNAQASEFLAEKIHQDGHREVAVLYILDSFGKDYQENFVKSFIDLGGDIVADEGYNPNEKDFSSHMTKIKNSEPDAIVIFPTIEGTQIAKKIEEFNLNLPLYGSSTVGSKPNVAGVENLLEGIIYPVNKVDTANPEYVEFERKFVAKYGRKPSIAWISANSYDTIQTLYNAIKRYGSSPEHIKIGLYATQGFKGATGTVSFDENGDAFTDLQLMTLNDGKGVPLKN